MHFNFPPKKGTGISRLLPNCPAPALSLLYQMLAYDSDERIAAETALRHTYFREIRLGAQLNVLIDPQAIAQIIKSIYHFQEKYGLNLAFFFNQNG